MWTKIKDAIKKNWKNWATLGLTWLLGKLKNKK